MRRLDLFLNITSAKLSSLVPRPLRRIGCSSMRSTTRSIAGESCSAKARLGSSSATGLRLRRKRL
ncbi:hypothetical protein IP87_02845 [beta proteobacterium AAP121]|nr:hypothetical protein IP80_11285 [beta proteobacterium AAP65]KPG00305.1 hypothetical protein IP87_02845 [beta proteobacterium AAP121]